MGLFDFISDAADTVGGWFSPDEQSTNLFADQFLGPGGRPPDESSSSIIPSELGGSLTDWLGGGVAANPNTQFSGWGDIFTPGFFDQGGAGNPLPAGNGGFPGFPLDTSIPITLGGDMAQYDLPLEGFDPGYSTQGGAMVRRVPWATIFAILGAATRTFGAQFLPQIVSALGARIGVPPGQILFRFLKRKGRRRSTRGITGRQLSITRRTIGKVNRMHQLLHRGGGYRRAPSPFRRKARR